MLACFTASASCFCLTFLSPYLISLSVPAVLGPS
jgi:hypothetical protein